MKKSKESDNYLIIGQKISTKEKISLGFGELGTSLYIGIFSFFLLQYYINVLKINYSLFIIANIIYLIYNTLNDVVFGFLADRIKSKAGRRIPFIKYGAPFFAISFLVFWFPFPGYDDPNNGQIILFIQLLVGFLFFDTMFTMVVLSYAALLPEITESNKERNEISSYRMIFQFIGAATILIVPLIFSLGLEIFRIFLIIIACIGCCLFLILSYKIKERKDLYQKSDKIEGNILKETIKALKNRTFITFVIFNFGVIFVQALMFSFATLFVYIVGLDLTGSMLILLLVYVGNLMVIPIVLYFGKRIENRIIIIILCVIIISVNGLLFIIDLIFNIFVVYWIIFILDGFIIGFGVFVVPYISEAIDIEELKTNQRKEGMYFGLNALITKPAEQLPAIIGTSILAISGFIQSEIIIPQPASAIMGLKIMAVIFPIFFAIILIISQIINPLKGEYLKSIKKQIIEMHSKKETSK